MNTQVQNLKQLYETDRDRWLEETIRLLNNRQLEDIDCQNLIEELEDLGNEQKRAVESLLEQVIRHLLLYQYWQSQFKENANHWEAEIIGFRSQLRRRLTTNLRQHLSKELHSLYQDALRFVKAKTKLNLLPSECHYSLDNLLDEDWLPKQNN
jgi:predicted unusual protein kinase regulating ubiquinone biosynthesis (AarF/ABC1/UbiB family)